MRDILEQRLAVLGPHLRERLESGRAEERRAAAASRQRDTDENLALRYLRPARDRVLELGDRDHVRGRTALKQDCDATQKVQQCELRHGESLRSSFIEIRVES